MASADVGAGAGAGAGAGSFVVEDAQRRLVNLQTLCQQNEGAGRALAALVQRQQGAAQGRDPRKLGADADQLQQQVKKCEEMMNKLRADDADFLARVKAGAATPGSKAFKAKKLKSDYDRRLQVAASLRATDQSVKRAKLVLAELRKQQRLAEASAAKSRAEASGAQSADREATRAQLETRQAAYAQRKASSNRGAPYNGISSNSNNSQQQLLLQQEQQQTYALREYDEQSTTQSEQSALREVARSAQLVEEMATEVGSLLEVQTDDVNRLEENTDDSVARTMEGVHELSRARRRQASTGAAKATFGTATVGGLVGILGGPVGIVIGAAAGGVVGMVAGKGVAAVKRRSINAETRRIKALLSARKQRTGEFTLQVYAFEVQQWSYMMRKWIQTERMWTDEFGEPVRGAHPEKDTSAAEARLQLLAEARADSNNLTPEEEAEIEAVHEREIAFDVVWSWASPKWDLVVDRANTDLSGWDFASKATANNWFPEAQRGCVVRRRLWVRYLTGKPGTSPAHQAAAEKLARARAVQEAMDNDSAIAPADRETKQLWNGIYRSSVTTNTILSESYARANEQGEQISRAERNAALVGDAAMYTQRIDRAANLSGALRNFVTWRRGQLQNVDAATQDQILRREVADKREELLRQEKHRQEERRRALQENGADFSLEDEAASNFSENLNIAGRMSSELETQNQQLERTAAAVERGNASVLKITRKLKS